MTTARIAPPSDHNDKRWHWIETEHGMMCASWYPELSEAGVWDISGHGYDAAAPRALREWRYVGPALPPNTDEAAP